MDIHLNETVVNGNVHGSSIYVGNNIAANNENNYPSLYKDSYNKNIKTGDYLEPGIYIMYMEQVQASNNTVSYFQSFGVVPWIPYMQTNVGCGLYSVKCNSDYTATIYNSINAIDNTYKISCQKIY